MGEAVTRVVLAGGGTAGHVNPLLAVAAALGNLDPQVSVSVIGTTAGLERELVPQAGYELDTIEKVPFPRRPDGDAIMFPARWVRETHRVRRILERRRAQVVVGFGGYASAPVYAVAHRMGIPIAIHEQNARAGMANRLGGRWADFIGTAYEDTGLKPRDGAEIRRVGLPLRPTIARLCERLRDDRKRTRIDTAQQLGLDPDRAVVVVTGGSLGALSLNRAVAGAADALLGDGVQVVHLTGKGKIDEVRAMVDAAAGQQALADVDTNRKRSGVGDYHVAEYLERIDLAFGCADLVICRAGAGSVSELSALGLPAVYVPLPIGNGEQRFNAKPVVEAGGALMVDDSRFTSTWVRAHVPGLLRDRTGLEAIGRKAWNYGIRDAAQIMARRVLHLAQAGDEATVTAR